MKCLSILLFVCFVVVSSASAQSFRYDSISQRWTYQKVIKVDSTLSKDVLFDLARTWMVRNYHGTKKTLEVEDKAVGKMVLNGREKDLGFGYDVLYTHIVECKDGRVRVTITDFTELVTISLSGVKNDPMPLEKLKYNNANKKGVFKRTEEMCARLCDDMERNLKSPEKPKNDGW